ncbi:MAG: NUDIX domain-containing protein [Candidatus Diapherotrites archaeon]|nr:NUDIX domain-containing protein [Candidatus Diapherotrites archaeon]
MKKEKSAGAIVFFDSKPRVFLVLHYAKGHWDFPKGHVEKGESEQEAMLRELLEETGISDFEIICGFRKRISYSFIEKGQVVKKEVIFFLVESKTKEVYLSDEHIGYEWLSCKKALEKITFSNSAEVLKKANIFLDRLGKIKKHKEL